MITALLATTWIIFSAIVGVSVGKYLGRRFPLRPEAAK